MIKERIWLDVLSSILLNLDVERRYLLPDSVDLIQVRGYIRRDRGAVGCKVSLYRLDGLCQCSSAVYDG